MVHGQDFAMFGRDGMGRGRGPNSKQDATTKQIQYQWDLPQLKLTQLNAVFKSGFLWVK